MSRHLAQKMDTILDTILDTVLDAASVEVCLLVFVSAGRAGCIIFCKAKTIFLRCRGSI